MTGGLAPGLLGVTPAESIGHGKMFGDECGAVAVKGQPEEKETHQPHVDVANHVKETAVACALCDKAVQVVVRPDELTIAGLVVAAVLVRGKAGDAGEFGVGGALGGQRGGFRLEDELHLLEVVELGYGQRRDHVAAIGRDADETFALQTAADLAYRRATGGVVTAQLGFGKRFSRGERAFDDVLSYSLVQSFNNAGHDVPVALYLDTGPYYSEVRNKSRPLGIPSVDTFPLPVYG